MATWSQTSKTQQNEPKAKPTNTTTTPKPDNIHMDKMKHKRTSLNNKTTLKYQNKQDNNKKKQGKKHTTTNTTLTTPNIIKKRTNKHVNLRAIRQRKKPTQRNNKRKHLIIILQTIMNRRTRSCGLLSSSEGYNNKNERRLPRGEILLDQ